MLPDKNIVALSTINRKVNMWKNEQSLPYGVTAAQVPIIIVVCQQEGILQNDVVEQLSLEKSVVAKSVGKLIKAGFLTREVNTKDKRAYNLFPTKKALDIYPKLVKQGQECMNRLTTGFSDEEQKQLDILLEKLLQNTFTQL